MRNRIISLLAVIFLLSALCLNVSAHEVPDMSRSGSITIRMTHEGEAVPGGSLTLYQVGAVHEDDGNYSFVPTGDFAECGLSFADITATTLPGSLSDYAKAQNLEGTTVQITEEGVASFPDLTLGLYLLVQNDAPDGYTALSPFVVSVPTNEGGSYVYDVDAAPKVQLTPAPTEPTEEETEPTKPTEPSLPQTGQLNWPVPLLAVIGLGLFVMGWILRFRQKKEGYEK